jgi:3-hydroxybutyrate dehydrogenase
MPALSGHHAVVTGGGRGIGRACAAALSQAGATVTVIGRTETSLQDAVAQKHAAGYAVADVTDEEAIKSAFSEAVRARGPISLLVANAGGAESVPFGKTTPDLFRRLFELNALSVVHGVHAVLGDMTTRGFGRIVVVASTAGLRGGAYISAYVTAKHAVVGLVRALAAETVKTGVTVNAVCPSYVDTDLVGRGIEKITQLTGRSREDALATMLKANPIGRLITPEEVAAAVVFLCSRDAAAITGAALPMGGEV